MLWKILPSRVRCLASGAHRPREPSISHHFFLTFEHRLFELLGSCQLNVRYATHIDSSFVSSQSRDRACTSVTDQKHRFLHDVKSNAGRASKGHRTIVRPLWRRSQADTRKPVLSGTRALLAQFHAIRQTSDRPEPLYQKIRHPSKPTGDRLQSTPDTTSISRLLHTP